MKDIQRVWALWWLAALPFIIACIVIIIVTGMTVTASQLTMVQFLSLVVAAVFGFLVFWKHPRLRHYNRVFAEYEENYRYVSWREATAGYEEEAQ